MHACHRLHARILNIVARTDLSNGDANAKKQRAGLKPALAAHTSAQNTEDLGPKLAKAASAIDRCAQESRAKAH